MDLSPYTEEQIKYHHLLIYEAGFAEGEAWLQFGSPRKAPSRVLLKRLTWEGHEFLDKIRSERTWNKVKVFLKERGMSLSFEALRMALTTVIHNQLS